MARANASLQWELAAPERKAERERLMAARGAELDALAEERYQRMPSLRQSPAEKRAEALRAEADSIEANEFDRWLEERRLEKLNELQDIIAFLKRRQ